MRLATARDELEPLRAPGISGPDDPRLTILVLARVVEQLGTLSIVTTHEIENLFAADLAFLQDFYGVINFGSQEEYEDLIRSQREVALIGTGAPGASAEESAREPEPAAEASAPPDAEEQRPPTLRSAVEEIPRRAQQ
jgi:hypothetical protein